MSAAATACPGLVAAVLDAQGDGIEANMSRWLAFVGHAEPEPFELQALNVKFGQGLRSYCAHARSLREAAALLAKAEREFDCAGLYIIGNPILPAVATRAEPGKWHAMHPREGTSDSEIACRRMLYVDVDAQRPKNTSATEAQVSRALEVAKDIEARFARVLPEVRRGLGHSGNGAGVFLALDGVAEADAGALVRGIVTACSALFSEPGEVEIDKSVTDAKRLVPAWGTLKRKGASGLADRPHRRTAFAYSTGRAATADDLRTLLESLRGDLDADGSAATDKAMGIKPPPRSSAKPSEHAATDDPFARAKEVPIGDVLEALGLWDGAPVCPGCGLRDSGVAIVGNGLKCSHARCASRGYRAGFRTTIDVVMEAQGLSALEAVAWLADRFGFEGPRRRERTAATAQTQDVTPAEDEPAFRVKWAPELAEPLPPVDWLCEGLRLACGSYATAAGESFGGKSLAGADMAVAVASGKAVFGLYSVKPGRVLWLDYDGQGDRISRDRLQRLAQARGFGLAELGDRLGYVWLPRVRLDDSDALDRFAELLEGVSLCVIDSWRGAAPATDEAKRGEVQRVGDTVLRIIERTGCTVLIVDHTVKPPREGAKSTRSAMHDIHGSTAKSELAQWQWVFDKQKDKPVKVLHTKERLTGRCLEPFSLRFEDVEIDGNPRGGLRVVHIGPEQQAEEDERQTRARWAAFCDRILALLATSPDVAGTEAMAGMLGVRPATIRPVVNALLADGRIANAGTRQRPKLRLA